MNLAKQKSKIFKQVNSILDLQKKADSEFNKKKHIICVTGKMAAGKNFVCSVFNQFNFTEIDLDKEVHKIIKQQAKKIFDTFENLAIQKNLKIRNEDNSLNTKQLGTLLFSDKQLLQKQQNIIYPILTKNILSIIEKSKNNIILNATVLFNTPELLKKCDFIVFVQSNIFKRFIRAKKRDKLALGQILKRFISQKKLKVEYLNTNIPLYNIKN